MSLSIKIVTPSAIVYEGTAESVQVPGWLGEYGVLPHHASMLTLSKPGTLKIHTGKETTLFVVDRGFVEVGPSDMSVMVNQCINVDDIDKQDAQQKYEEAKNTLSGLSSSDPAYAAAQKKVEFSRVLASA